MLYQHFVKDELVNKIQRITELYEHAYQYIIYVYVSILMFLYPLHKQYLSSLLFQGILRASCVFAEFKRSSFKEKTRHIFDYYHPIALLSSISKTLVIIQIYDFISNNGLLYSNQCGFNKLHSREYVPFQLVNRISQHFGNGKLSTRL